ncbi:MAG: hypothetical protein ABF991_00070 [Liquorilactobacillus hordei]|uniref:hypothetical protein n=1 Tax=Liquorilactobacillus hordei TaxID=468911 RepID=UPI0039EB8DEB
MDKNKKRLLIGAFDYLKKHGEYAIDDSEKPQKNRSIIELLTIFENFDTFIYIFDVLKDEMDYFGVSRISEKDLSNFTKEYLSTQLV